MGRSLNEEQHRFIGQMRKIGIQLPAEQSKTSVVNVETPKTASRHEFICKHQPTAPSMDGISSFFNYCEDNDCDEENNDKQAPFLRRNAVQKNNIWRYCCSWYNFTVVVQIRTTET